MNELPFISIIICTYNRADYLRDTLHSLLHTGAPHELFEVLVIDNNSTDQTAAIVQETTNLYSDFKLNYVEETAQGLSYARNRGIREATAPVILFLDDDVSVHPDFIPAWIRFFKNQPEASGGGGKIHVQFDGTRPDWMSHFLLPLLGHHDLGNSLKPYPSNKYPFGGNMAYKKEIFKKYGFFDTKLGRKGSQLTASEEKEFYNRMAGKEDIYYLPDAYLYHRVNEQRLTEQYIKKQAYGLGQSISRRTNHASVITKLWHLAEEFTKSIATTFLSIGYSITLQVPKATMLVKFRYWIWQGYHQTSNLLKDKDDSNSSIDS